jgi:hypothetical protein
VITLAQLVVKEVTAHYQRWITQSLYKSLVRDGLLDTDPAILGWMNEALSNHNTQEMSLEERRDIVYESRYRTVDEYLSLVIEATRTINGEESIERAQKDDEILSVRFEEYLTDSSERPLPLVLTQETFVKVIDQFLQALSRAKPTKRSYYLRHYDRLIEEGQRWIEYWVFQP